MSEDEGETWTSIHDRGALHNTAVLHETILAMYISGDLYVSRDWGDSWLKSTYGPTEASYVYEAAAIGGDFFMSNNYGVHQSSDRGHTWQLVFHNEGFLFFDFLAYDGVLLAGTR